MKEKQYETLLHQANYALAKAYHSQKITYTASLLGDFFTLGYAELRKKYQLQNDNIYKVQLQTIDNLVLKALYDIDLELKYFHSDTIAKAREKFIEYFKQHDPNQIVQQVKIFDQNQDYRIDDKMIIVSQKRVSSLAKNSFITIKYLLQSPHSGDKIEMTLSFNSSTLNTPQIKQNIRKTTFQINDYMTMQAHAYSKLRQVEKKFINIVKDIHHFEKK